MARVEAAAEKRLMKYVRKELRAKARADELSWMQTEQEIQADDAGTADRQQDLAEKYLAEVDRAELKAERRKRRREQSDELENAHLAEEVTEELTEKYLAKLARREAKTAHASRKPPAPAREQEISAPDLECLAEEIVSEDLTEKYLAKLARRAARSEKKKEKAAELEAFEKEIQDVLAQGTDVELETGLQIQDRESDLVQDEEDCQSEALELEDDLAEQEIHEYLLEEQAMADELEFDDELSLEHQASSGDESKDDNDDDDADEDEDEDEGKLEWSDVEDYLTQVEAAGHQAVGALEGSSELPAEEEPTEKRLTKVPRKAPRSKKGKSKPRARAAESVEAPAEEPEHCPEEDISEDLTQKYLAKLARRADRAEKRLEKRAELEAFERELQDVLDQGAEQDPDLGMEDADEAADCQSDDLQLECDFDEQDSPFADLVEQDIDDCLLEEDSIADELELDEDILLEQRVSSSDGDNKDVEDDDEDDDADEGEDKLEWSDVEEYLEQTEAAGRKTAAASSELPAHEEETVEDIPEMPVSEEFTLRSLEKLERRKARQERRQEVEEVKQEYFSDLQQLEAMQATQTQRRDVNKTRQMAVSSMKSMRKSTRLRSGVAHAGAVRKSAKQPKRHRLGRRTRVAAQSSSNMLPQPSPLRRRLRQKTADPSNSGGASTGLVGDGSIGGLDVD